MEILIFALIASCNVHRPQKRVITEAEGFQPFDLKTLRHFAGNKPIRSSGRRKVIRATNRLSVWHKVGFPNSVSGIAEALLLKELGG